MTWAIARRTLLRALAVAGLCCAVGSVALSIFGLRGGGRTSDAFARWPFLDMWLRWDAGWYQAIATAGYYFSPTEQSPVAYFPAYPLLMRALWTVGINGFVAGILVTLASAAVALVLFRSWAQTQSDAAAAERSLWIVLLWPFAYYLYGAIYSDALFLALVVGAFLCLERGRLWGAVALGVVATATRPVAPAVVLGLLVRQLELRRKAGQPWRAVDFAPVLSGLGLLAYMGYLGWRFGDPIAFVTTQAGWAQAPGAAWLGKFGLTASLLSSAHPEDALLPLFHLALALLMIGAGFAVRKRLGWGYAVYMWCVLGMPLAASRDFISLGRYALAAFPGFLILSEWLAPRPRARWAWLLASGFLLAWMVSRFALGHYVA